MTFLFVSCSSSFMVCLSWGSSPLAWAVREGSLEEGVPEPSSEGEGGRLWVGGMLLAVGTALAKACSGWLECGGVGGVSLELERQVGQAWGGP